MAERANRGTSDEILWNDFARKTAGYKWVEDKDTPGKVANSDGYVDTWEGGGDEGIRDNYPSSVCCAYF
jgi:hypothetical protein